MAGRSLNKVLLIGNLTRDPNLRYTPNGTGVCNFGIATNRTWASADGGEKQEEVEFHNIVAWAKLADICGQLLHKGDKVYVEGRIQTRDWKTDEGQDRKSTEIVIENMMLLNSRSGNPSAGGSNRSAAPRKEEAEAQPDTEDDFEPSADAVTDVEDVADDIPF